MKKLLLSFLFLVLAGSLLAQPMHYNATAGSGNTFPLGQTGGKAANWLFPPSVFNQPAPCPPGQEITKIYVRMYGTGTRAYTNLHILMAQTTLTNLTTGTFYAGPYDTVFAKDTTLTSAGANTWMGIQLHTPYPYDPTKALVVFMGQCGGTGSGMYVLQTTLTGTKRTWSVGGCPFVPYAGGDARNLCMGIDVQSAVPPQPRNVLLEFCTGTWCPSCPGGHTAAHNIQIAYPNTVIIAYHGPAGGSDPFSNFSGNGVISMLGYQGYPTGIIDRMNHPGNNGNPYPWVTYSQWMGRVQTRYNTSPIANVGIDIVSVTYYPPTRELKAIVKTTAQQNLNGVFKLQYVLTEDSLIYPQSGGGSNYQHDLVVRDMINGPTGTTLSSGTWTQNTTFTDTLSTNLNASWLWYKCTLNMFVYRDSTGQLFHSTVQQAIDTSLSLITGITNNNNVPEHYSLEQNYPNPFNPTTYIHFSIPKSGNVSLKVYDIQGREITEYFNEFLNAGTYNFEFDGSGLSSGVYFYRLVAGDFVSTKKMILTK